MHRAAVGDLVDVRWFAEPERVDERHRLRRAAEDLGQARAGLPQREIERRGLERPAPPVALHLVLGRLGPHVDRVDVREEVRQRRPLAYQRVLARAQALLVARHADLLADALLTEAL